MGSATRTDGAGSTGIRDVGVDDSGVVSLELFSLNASTRDSTSSILLVTHLTQSGGLQRVAYTVSAVRKPRRSNNDYLPSGPETGPRKLGTLQ